MHPSIRLTTVFALLFVPLGGCGSSGEGSEGSETSPPGVSVTLSDSDAPPVTATDSGSGESTNEAPTSTDGASGGSSTDAVEPTSTGGSTGSSGDSSSGEATDSVGETTTGEGGLWNTPNLWYAVDKAIVYVELDAIDGSVVQLVDNQLMADAPLWNGQNGLTMLEDGSLLGSRESDAGTQIYHVAAPPITPDTPATAKLLGTVPAMGGGGPPRVEALYTDCDGRVYLMDTGEDVGSSDGNRLLRFTGNYLAGDLAYQVITDLQNASVGDIDDMSPGVFDGEISDGLGFAMDSGVLWKIDYTSGTGDNLAMTDGSWGVHALGGPLFADLNPRVYILSSGAALMQVALDDYSSSAPLIVGPDLMLRTGYNGWSGLAGPLTECESTIPQ